MKPGNYIVTVEVGDDHRDYNVDTSNSGSTDPDKPNPDPKPDTDKVQVTGIVVTDHKRPLAGSVITVRNMDSDKTFTITADADGKFSTGEMDKGRYELVAEYTHKYGTNESDPLNITASQDDAVMVIVLKYVDDVNGDGKNETVYAGDDDKFDTPDDWYPADIDKDGKDEKIFAGEDGKPGTKDDWYEKDTDGDGKPEKHPIGVIEVNFDANGGSVNGTSVYTVETSKISNLPTATRSGYTFNGSQR